jgi:hypothetical protein
LTDARFETILKVFKALSEKVKFNMSILNVACNDLRDVIECGYSSTDDRPLSTEPLIDLPSNYCLATCNKADTHKIQYGGGTMA